MGYSLFPFSQIYPFNRLVLRKIQKYEEAIHCYTCEI